jgi:alkylation response protein AidB-like acyl-CoA dehydrogenase
VLARTDADAPAHKGISYLIVDLRSPGIEIRPLVQVTGDPEFGEVFFDGVEVPKENLLGPLHGGWRIAMHTLAHERGQYALSRQVVLRVLLDRVIDSAQRITRDGRPAIETPAIRTALAQATIGVEVLKHQCYRSEGRAAAQGGPGFETSVDKLVLGQVEHQVAEVAMDVLGPHTADSPWHHAYLYGRAGSVYGGSAQIQKNIVAERILGLPRSQWTSN